MILSYRQRAGEGRSFMKGAAVVGSGKCTIQARDKGCEVRPLGDLDERSYRRRLLRTLRSFDKSLTSLVHPNDLNALFK